MASTAHGKAWELSFQERWEAIDRKKSWTHRLVDASDLYGLNGKMVNAFSSPGDFIIGYNGWLALCDCKSTIDPKGFKVSLVKKPQIIAATLSVAAGTPYVFPVMSVHTGNSYFVPADVVLSARGTIPWDDLACYLWLKEMKCPNIPT